MNGHTTNLENESWKAEIYTKKKRHSCDFVKSKAENIVEVWLSSIFCPIIKVDGTFSIENNVKLIAEKLENQF